MVEGRIMDPGTVKVRMLGWKRKRSAQSFQYGEERGLLDRHKYTRFKLFSYVFTLSKFL